MLRQGTALSQQAIRTHGSINPRDATLGRTISAPFAVQSFSHQEGFEVRPKFDGRLIREPFRRNCNLLSHAVIPIGHAGRLGTNPITKAKYCADLRL
jgi:hypothetical protein